jgi:hypothetical protein
VGSRRQNRPEAAKRGEAFSNHLEPLPEEPDGRVPARELPARLAVRGRVGALGRGSQPQESIFLRRGTPLQGRCIYLPDSRPIPRRWPGTRLDFIRLSPDFLSQGRQSCR